MTYEACLRSHGRPLEAEFQSQCDAKPCYLRRQHNRLLDWYKAASTLCWTRCLHSLLSCPLLSAYSVANRSVESPRASFP